MAGFPRKESKFCGLTRGRGRPPKATRKVNQTIRLDSEVLADYQQEGCGWQTLINPVLRKHMLGHQK